VPKWTQQQLAATKVGRNFLVAEIARVTTDSASIGVPTLSVRDPEMVTVTLPYPPSANRYWRSIVIKGAVRVLVSKEAKKYRAACKIIAAAAFKRPMEGPVGIRLLVYRPLRLGDLSNRIKVVEDVLQGFAYDNDAQIECIEARRFDDKINPRVVVSVWKLDCPAHESQFAEHQQSGEPTPDKPKQHKTP